MRLIDADALLEELKACDFVASSIIGDGDTLLFEDDVIKRIKGMPTAERVGKWINDKGLYRCSACNELWCHWWVNIVSIERMNKMMHYCPNCGARMVRGVGENDER